MMAGRKHLAGFDSIPEASNDSVFQNKRIFAGSSFDAHRAQSSQQQSIGAPPLDTHRAELSRQHVRALNTQFASWVHSQLQNHPDELWEDGVQDYLDHASNVKEKFSDIVNWLKANALKGERVFGLGSQDAPKKPLFENKDNQIKLDKEQTSLGMVSATPSFAPPSWSSGAFATQTSFSFGNQIVASSNNDASNDVDDEEELQQPSSPSVKKTKEEGIIVVHEVKCKLYVKSSDPVDKDAWKDKGMGQLSIKCKEGVSKGTRESKPIILVRNDVGRIVLNASLYPGIKTNMQKNSIVAIFHTTGESGNDGGENNGVVAQTFLIRTRTEDDRDKLASAIQEYAPTA